MSPKTSWALIVLAAAACTSSTPSGGTPIDIDASTTLDASSPGSGDAQAPSNEGGPTEAGATGGCSNGPNAPSAAVVTSMTSLAGGWHFIGIRQGDGSDGPVLNVNCDPSTTYYISAAANPPSAGDPAPAPQDMACRIANSQHIPIYGGTNTHDYPDCNVLACGGSIEMDWDDTSHVGAVFSVSAGKATRIATISFDKKNPKHLLYENTQAVWIMEGTSALPECK